MPAVVGKLLGLRKARTVRQSASRPYGAFVQMRQEFRADDPSKAQVHGSGQSNRTHASHNPTMLDRPTQSSPILLRKNVHHWITSFAHPFAEKRRSQYGSNQDGERHGAQEGKGDSPSHWAKQPALHTLQSKDRQVSGDDDRNGVKHRPLNFMARLADEFRSCFRTSQAVPSSMCKMPDDVFHHHDGTVHNHAEIEGAK